MFWYKIFSILLLISHGRVFSGALYSILDFFEFEEFQYTRRSSLLDSTVNRWTQYSSFSSKINFHRVTEFYSKYSTLKHARITSNIEFKVTRKSSTRLAIFKSFPDSILDSTLARLLSRRCAHRQTRPWLLASKWVWLVNPLLANTQQPPQPPLRPIF